MRWWVVAVSFAFLFACGGNQGSVSGSVGGDPGPLGDAGTGSPSSDGGSSAPDAGLPPPAADGGAPPAADGGAPPAADGGAPPAADGGAPPAADGGSAGGPSPDAGVSSYAIVEIPPVVGASGGTFADIQPTSINSLGQVVGGFHDCVSVGMSECDDGPFSAFLYDPAKGTTVRISHPDASDHAAAGINDKGAILLNGNPHGDFDGFVLSNGNATHFGEEAVVGGINSRGWVSGTNEGPGGQFAFLWDGATVRPLAPPSSLGAGLNEAGVVVGTVFAGGAGHASVFGGGAVQDLGTLPGDPQSFAVAINDDGRVVGFSMDGLFTEHAFVFDLPDGPMRDVLPNGSSSLSSVNEGGDAVGSILRQNSPVSAILWHEGTVVDLTHALNDPTWQLLSATAINDKGQICGVGLHGGEERGFVLVPR